MKIKIEKREILLLGTLLVVYLMYHQQGHKVYGKIAKNKDELKNGLMWRKDKLKYNEGMLFPMTYQKNNMWMKNTYIPLDVIFLDKSMGIVGYVEDTVPLSLKDVSIDKPSQYVLEMNSGSVRLFGMEIGDKISFTEL